ncbi:hypothetical protein [Paraburkholderia saeva]|uniref:Uncharacterized protein n=1 Tax=Paraburkholderia saeva TaxID=2777537 RepID=A0A9N8RYZ6_9BURK|nr:hypothetical protein [Paraburkholderia saeva]CAG4905651.1 hypothetical protein LMG31841_03472 [Paraburkholderia saeva]
MEKRGMSDADDDEIGLHLAYALVTEQLYFAPRLGIRAAPNSGNSDLCRVVSHMKDGTGQALAQSKGPTLAAVAELVKVDGCSESIRDACATVERVVQAHSRALGVRGAKISAEVRRKKEARKRAECRTLWEQLHAERNDTKACDIGVTEKFNVGYSTVCRYRQQSREAGEPWKGDDEK